MCAPMFRRKAMLLALAAAFQLSPWQESFATDATEELADVVVSARKIQPPATATSDKLGQNEVAARRASLSDTAQLLRELPGVALSATGGVSSLPVLRGLADDRNRIEVDGMPLISACGNHMNPPLSYIDPTNVDSARVYAGITPVSVGGDSIGGTIIVTSRAPRFASVGQGILSSGEVGAFYRSNGHAHGGNLSATLASETLSIAYQGSTAEAGNYHAAGDFKPGSNATWTRSGTHWIAGDEVGSSAYKTENHSLTLAMRDNDQRFDFKLGWQRIPYQGFPNQHMDMTGNRSTQVNLGYQRAFDWGNLQARLYNEQTRHDMDFAEDKLYWYGTAHNVAGMPMATKSRNTGVRFDADLQPSKQDTLRVGGEYQRYRLDDGWSPVANSMMMSPNSFQNINDGQRDRFDIYAEWEQRPSAPWLTLLGLRVGSVKMAAGNVQGYNTMPMMYGNDAARFNSSQRSKTDYNVDLTVLARYSPNANQTYEAGYARKTRSPSLYERYTWSTNGMAMTMNNWLNDGNGYVGDIDLKPEVAHTLSFTADLHAENPEQNSAAQPWHIRLTPYYSRVDNYIDARCLTTCLDDKFNYLKLVNADAHLYGVDVSAVAPLGNVGGIGRFTGKGVLAYVNGKTTGSGDRLYNIMPLNARLAVEHRLANWSNTVELLLVAAKSHVSQVRNEMQTSGYSLLNLRSSYDSKNYRFDLGVENATNKQYAQPLGGAYIGQGATMSLNGSGAPYGIPLPGMGRNLYAGLTLKF